MSRYATSAGELKWLKQYGFVKTDIRVGAQDNAGERFNAYPDVVLYDKGKNRVILIDYKHNSNLMSRGKSGGKSTVAKIRSDYNKATMLGQGRGTKAQRNRNAKRLGWNHSVWQKIAQKTCLSGLGGFDVEYWVVDPSSHKHHKNWTNKMMGFTNGNADYDRHQFVVFAEAKNYGVELLSCGDFDKRWKSGRLLQMMDLPLVKYSWYTTDGELMVGDYRDGDMSADKALWG
jgi:hypothetical protein